MAAIAQGQKLITHLCMGNFRVRYIQICTLSLYKDAYSYQSLYVILEAEPFPFASLLFLQVQPVDRKEIEI